MANPPLQTPERLTSLHTPGPWVVILNSEGEPNYIQRANGEQSAECQCPQCQRDGKSWGGRRYTDLVTCDSHVYGPTLHDAYLMAAAPELKHACAIALALLEQFVQGREDVHDLLRAALAKTEPPSRG